eukprot:19210-Pleurochrysis_carterae.AAC.2
MELRRIASRKLAFTHSFRYALRGNLCLRILTAPFLTTQERTIGVLTMCDDAGKRNLKAIPGRLDQTSADRQAASPRLSCSRNVTLMLALRRNKDWDRLPALAAGQGTCTLTSSKSSAGGGSSYVFATVQDEDEWFTSQSVLGPMLDKGGVLGCGALVDKILVLRDGSTTRTAHLRVSLPRLLTAAALHAAIRVLRRDSED